MLEMIAKMRFPYAGKVIHAGEHFEALSERDAEALSLTHRAEMREGGGYRRRDMQATKRRKK